MFSWGEDHRACTRQHRQTSEPRSWHWIFIATSAEKHYFSSTTYDKGKHFSLRERKLLPTYTYQSTDFYYRTQRTFLHTIEGTAKRRREDRRGWISSGEQWATTFSRFRRHRRDRRRHLQYQRKTITTYRARGALRTISIKHTVISTESHEKVAEAHFSWLSKAIDRTT